jgi:signal transduction histidine kinase
VVIREPDFQQVLVLLGEAIFMYAAVRDILFYNHIYIFPYGAYSNDPLSEVALLLLVFMLLAAMLLNTMQEIRDQRDKEQRLASENALLEHSNRLRTDIMNTISHETKTPLAVLSGYAEIVAMELRSKGVDEQHAADLDMISAEARNVAELMQGLQEMARIKDASAEKSEVDLCEVVTQTARLYVHILERRNTQLILDLPKDLPPIYGNAAGLTQVLFNLLSNAGKHTENGTVTIAVREMGDCLSVTVTDTGEGIAQDFIPHAFEWRTHDDPAGTGLGLSICHQIITMHDGDIALESEEGKGTVVTFIVPLYKEDRV